MKLKISHLRFLRGRRETLWRQIIPHFHVFYFNSAFAISSAPLNSSFPKWKRKIRTLLFWEPVSAA